MPKPLQRPHPPIVVTAVAPFSKGVTEAAARGWDPISANFLMPQWVRTHWPRYAEGCARTGRGADPANWRVAKSVFVAEDSATARDYATGPDSPYRFWDGTYSGTPSPIDTYVWRIDLTELSGESRMVIGHVNLVR